MVEFIYPPPRCTCAIGLRCVPCQQAEYEEATIRQGARSSVPEPANREVDAAEDFVPQYEQNPYVRHIILVRRDIHILNERIQTIRTRQRNIIPSGKRRPGLHRDPDAALPKLLAEREHKRAVLKEYQALAKTYRLKEMSA